MLQVIHEVAYGYDLIYRIRPIKIILTFAKKACIV